MVRTATAVTAALLLAACSTNEATPSAGPSAGRVSLQTAPYAGEATAAAPTTPLAAPPVMAPATPVATPPDASASPLAGFDPAQQRFVWVLPPGIHGKGPWFYTATVKLRGETKHEAKIPLKAEILASGTRPEFPAGYEIIRLTDDGSWTSHAAGLERVINDLIAQHGRGAGELDLDSRLELTIDESHRKAYCDDGRFADARLYLDEPGKDLQRMDTLLTELYQPALKKACG
jgi:hypothetical protein